MTNDLKEDILFRYEYMDTSDFSLSAIVLTIASDVVCEYDEVMSVIVNKYGVFDD